MTSSQHGSYAWGDTHATMGGTAGMRWGDPEPIRETPPQFGLQAATRLHEVGVASNRRSAHGGEYVPGPCTHRPSHHGSAGGLKPLCPTGPLREERPEGRVEGKSRDWGEVVTR